MFNATFNNKAMAISFIGGRNWNTMRNHLHVAQTLTHDVVYRVHLAMSALAGLTHNISGDMP